MPSIIGTSHAKIILLGEHAVVYQQPAISLPILTIQTKVSFELISRTQPSLQSDYFQGNIVDMPEEMSGLKQLILATWQLLDNSQHAFHLKISSDIPDASGMGSSAAAAVAVVRALAKGFNQSISAKQLQQLANASEKVIHQNPSGIDVATTSSYQPLYFIKDQPPQALTVNLNGYLVIADSGEKGITRQSIQLVKDQQQENPKHIQTIMTDLGRLVNQSVICLKNAQLTELGQLFNQAQKQLSLLQVSTQKLDHLITIANQAGSLGTKLTGSGLGGCLIALAPNEIIAKNIASQLETGGAVKTWCQNLNAYH